MSPNTSDGIAEKRKLLLGQKKNKGGLMEDYTRYQLDELYNILSQVQQAIELLEEEEKKKNK